MSVQSIATSRMPSAFGDTRVFTKPAGQVTVTQVPVAVYAAGTGNCPAVLPANAIGCDANGNPVDASGAGAVIGTPTPVTTQSINTPAKPGDTQQALYNLIGPSIGFTGDAIKTAIETNNQQQLAMIQIASNRQLAMLQIQAQQAAQSGDLALASQKQQEAADIQQLNMQLSGSQGSITALYVIGALMVAGIIGAVVYSRRESRPSRRSDRYSSRATRSGSRRLSSTRS